MQAAYPRLMTSLKWLFLSSRDAILNTCACICENILEGSPTLQSPLRDKQKKKKTALLNGCQVVFASSFGRELSFSFSYAIKY